MGRKRKLKKKLELLQLKLADYEERRMIKIQIS